MRKYYENQIFFLSFCIIFSLCLSLASANKFLTFDKIRPAVSALQSFWWNETGGSWKGGSVDPDRGEDSGLIDWWNAANTLEVLANVHSIYPGDFNIRDLMKNMFSKQNISGILNSQSFDDSGWVALSWLRAYEETNEVEYYKRAKTFYDQILTAWDDVCGGGLYWAGDEEGGGFRYKNAVTNELFIYLSLRMSEKAPLNESEFYFAWGKRAWDWFKTSGMIQRIGDYYWIIDGLNDSCEPIGDYWSYNQGIILGALGKFFERSNDQEYADFADKLILSIIDKNLPQNPWLYEGGILREHCEPICGNSAKQFKGIYLRYIYYFYDSCLKRERPLNQTVLDFISKNSESLWFRARDSLNRFGLVWKGPINETNAIQQTAGIDLLIADYRLNFGGSLA